MKRYLAVLFIALTVLQGVALAAPFTYCFTGGELCCEGYSAEISCASPKAPGLNSCCTGTGLLLSSKAPSRSEVKTFTVQPEASGTAFVAPTALTVLQTVTPRAPFFSPPHLSSVILRI